ncbi:MAG TPA: hypothetical protein VMT00_13425 [Thermoanaerobaculia bacterium]|nr:hypothetical protein [Thermoanaerobaculia bacterium]
MTSVGWRSRLHSIPSRLRRLRWEVLRLAIPPLLLALTAACASLPPLPSDEGLQCTNAPLAPPPTEYHHDRPRDCTGLCGEARTRIQTKSLTVPVRNETPDPAVAAVQPPAEYHRSPSG